MSTYRTASLLLAFVPSCVLPPEAAPPPEPPTRYYSASVVMEQSDQADDTTNEHGPLVRDAGKVIHPGVKVAFYPPNRCETTPSEAGTGAAKEGDLIRMECGALISRLEAQAAKAGYEVVSWQALKHNAKPPLEMARELHVDVLFEINELSLNDRVLGTSRATGLRFGQQTDPVDRVDVAVLPDVADRCKKVVDPELARVTPHVLEAVLDAKGVEVKSGRAVWYYKRASHEESEQGERKGVDLYYPAPGRNEWKAPPRQHNALQRRGGIMAGLGGGLGLLIGGPMIAFGVEKDNNALVAGGATVVAVGVAAAIGGIVMIAVGNSRQRSQGATATSYPPPIYDRPEQRLCAVPAVTPPWLQVAAPTAATPTSSTNYAFTETTAGGKDEERARRERLVRGAADDFVAKLAELDAT